MTTAPSHSLARVIFVTASMRTQIAWQTRHFLRFTCSNGTPHGKVNDSNKLPTSAVFGCTRRNSWITVHELAMFLGAFLAQRHLRNPNPKRSPRVQRPKTLSVNKRHWLPSAATNQNPKTTSFRKNDKLGGKNPKLQRGAWPKDPKPEKGLGCGKTCSLNGMSGILALALDSISRRME